MWIWILYPYVVQTWSFDSHKSLSPSTWGRADSNLSCCFSGRIGGAFLAPFHILRSPFEDLGSKQVLLLGPPWNRLKIRSSISVGQYLPRLPWCQLELTSLSFFLSGTWEFPLPSPFLSSVIYFYNFSCWSCISVSAFGHVDVLVQSALFLESEV